MRTRVRLRSSRCHTTLRTAGLPFYRCVTCRNSPPPVPTLPPQQENCGSVCERLFDQKVNKFKSQAGLSPDQQQAIHIHAEMRESSDDSQSYCFCFVGKKVKDASKTPHETDPAQHICENLLFQGTKEVNGNSNIEDKVLEWFDSVLASN